MPTERRSSGAPTKTENTSAPADDNRFQFGQIYDRLCDIEVLRVAYKSLSTDFQAFDAGRRILESSQDGAIEQFLGALCSDLQSRQYHPGGGLIKLSADESERAKLTVLRDRLVQISIRDVVGPIFEPAPPSEPHSKGAIQWVAAALEGGLTHVYAANLERWLSSFRTEHFLKTVSERTGDAEMSALIRELIEVYPESGKSRKGILYPVFSDIACTGIDRILRQASGLGRKDGVTHVQCLRLIDEMIILTDNDPNFNWLLPAIYKRLSQELEQFNSKMDKVDVQSFNFANGQKLRFLGYELRAESDGIHLLRVRYRRIGRSEDEEDEILPAPPPEAPPASPVAEISDEIEEEVSSSAEEFPAAPLPSEEVLVVEPLPPPRPIITRKLLIIMVSIVAMAAVLLYVLAPLPLTPVEGKVNVSGMPEGLPPFDYGRVWLHPDRDKGNWFPRIPMAELNADGSYTVFTDGKPGAPPGWYRVAIVAIAGRRQLFDAKYWESNTSELTLHVESGAEPGAYDLALRSSIGPTGSRQKKSRSR